MEASFLAWKQGRRQENDQRMFISYNVPGTLFLYVI